MAGWAARNIGEVPKVTDGEADDPDWHPLQHFFGLTTFGANAFVATRGYETLVGEHDERSSGQQELYVVLEGEADFELAGEQVRATRGMVIAVTDPTVKRRAVARAPGTMLLAVGASEGPFSTTWRESHFENVPRADKL
ncbi:MAG TPA: hypothetical protein VGQ84_15260 [Gaiellaceae bacterium]|jgi:hypothetical protein|nr:hypothetical protein [Gaiellaceae bacterium]